MERCDTCKANKVCDHERFSFENCDNYIATDIVPRAEVEYWKEQCFNACMGNGFFKIDSITHWMPLPEPPEGSSDDA